MAIDAVRGSCVVHYKEKDIVREVCFRIKVSE